MEHTPQLLNADKGPHTRTPDGSLNRAVDACSEGHNHSCKENLTFPSGKRHVKTNPFVF